MTLTALAVLIAGLTAGGAGPVPHPAQPSDIQRSRQPARAVDPLRETSGEPGDMRPEVTCALRIVHAPANLDAGILAQLSARAGDPIVRDALSPCRR